jgi:NitT/TauT family transport system permease protein
VSTGTTVEHEQAAPAPVWVAPPRPKQSLLRRIISSRRTVQMITTPFFIALFLGIWKAYVELSDISPFLLPAPEAVGSALVGQVTDPELWKIDVWTTFYETVVGFGLGVSGGVMAGYAMGKSRLVEAIANPFVVTLKVIPQVALIPLFIIWFGFGATSKVASAAMLSFFPVLINTILGVRSVDPDLRELLKSIGANKFTVFRRLEAPYALAYVLSGAQVAILLAMTGAFVGEFLAGTKGLGRLLVDYHAQFMIPELYGAVVIMSMFGFTLYMSVRSLAIVLIPWHESVSEGKD